MLNLKKKRLHNVSIMVQEGSEAGLGLHLWRVWHLGILRDAVAGALHTLSTACGAQQMLRACYLPPPPAPVISLKDEGAPINSSNRMPKVKIHFSNLECSFLRRIITASRGIYHGLRMMHTVGCQAPPPSQDSPCPRLRR